MNKLLLRQIHKKFGNEANVPPDLLPFLQVVSDSYDHYEKDRIMQERSLELSSNEMTELNTRLKEETARNGKVIYEKLKELNILSEEIGIQHKEDEITIGVITEHLKSELEKFRIAEMKRNQHQMHLRASQRIARVGSWELRIVAGEKMSFNLVFVSEEACNILGFANETNITTRGFFGRVHPEDFETMANAMQRAIEEKNVYDLEHRILLPNGVEKIVHELAEIIYDEVSGIPVAVIGTLQDVTDQRKSEANLLKTSRELETLFQSMNECFFSVDMTRYQTIQISQSCNAIYGRPVSEFLQNANLWFDLILDEDKHIINDNYPLIYAGKPIRQSYRIMHKSGGIRWLESSITPTLDETGRLTRLDGITSDVTEREETQVMIRNNEYRFRSMIENASDAIMIMDDKSVVSYASDSLYRIMGYTPEEVIGVKAINFIYSDDLPLVEEHFKRSLANPKSTLSLIYRRIRKDGSIIWCEGSANNLLHDPVVQGVVVNFRDITEKKESENALKDSEYKFRSLIEHSSDAVTVINKDWMIDFASDSLYKLTGFHPHEVMGTTSRSYIHPDDMPEVERTFAELLKFPGQAISVTYRRLKKNGEYIWCEGVVNNLMQQPAVRGIVVNFRDITERKLAEETLKKTNAELKKANSELDRFVYSASHDLRAPLASMLGVIPLLEGQTTDPLMLNDIGLLKMSINKLDKFILNILDYARNSRMDIHKDNIDLEELLRTAINNLRFMGTGSEHIDIRVHADNTRSFCSDRNRLEIIFNNLLSNAIRYSNPKMSNPYVDISITHSDDTTRIKIEDNGIGISKENHQKVFDMFYRVSKKSIGSGIGLYIVKETVEKLNGSITMESELGKGTIFNIVLPNLINK